MKRKPPQPPPEPRIRRGNQVALAWLPDLIGLVVATPSSRMGKNRHVNPGSVLVKWPRHSRPTLHNTRYLVKVV